MASGRPSAFVRSPLQELSTFLENYWTRSQVFRTLQFASTLCAGLLERRHPSAAAKLITISSSIANMRVMLRLMDDVPVLAHALRSWRPQKNSPLILQASDLLYALSCQLYYPVEHVAWAAESNLLPLQPTPFWTAAVFLWGLSLLTSCLRNMLTLWKLAKEMASLQAQGTPGHVSPPAPSGNGNGRKRVTFQDEVSSTATRQRVLKQLFLQASLGLVQSVCDLMNAVHWMPPGFLWAGKLPTAWVGVFGTLSSLVGLYQILPCRPPAPQGYS